MKIDEEKAIIYGANGSASYFINDSGGLEIAEALDGGITDAEYKEAEEQLN